MTTETAAKTQNAPQEQDEQPLRILLVDDEPNIRQALEEYLTVIDQHKVTTASTGQEALEIFSSDRFDCAFLDLKMPGMDGTELLTRLRQKDPYLPVVIMTGYPSLDAAIDTMRQGASDFLVKPFNLNQVKLTLERVVAQHRLSRENLRLSEQVQHQAKIEDLNRELNRRIREQNIIHQISEEVGRLQNSEDIYQGMADLCCRFLETEKAAVLLVDRSNKNLLVIAAHGYDAPVVGRVVGNLGQDVCGKVAAEGEPMIGRPNGGSPFSRTLPTRGDYLCMPIKIREEVFGVLMVGDKLGGLPFRPEDIFVASFLLDKAALSVENIALYEAMLSNMRSTLGALVSAMEAKDPYTREHSRRVTNYSVLTAQTMGLGLEHIESLRFAAYLHDIGKIGIRDSVLQKVGKLTDEEYEHIKDHPVIGESIIKHMDLTGHERAIIRHHHERWDGGGYPDGLDRENTPLLARIVAVADAFDAMTSDRPYRKGKAVSEAAGSRRRAVWTTLSSLSRRTCCGAFGSARLVGR